MKNLINETYNIVQRTYTSKAGKSFLLVYIDPKTSTDSTYDAKEKFKEYGMVYLPNAINSKYMPHTWGWILWDGKNDKQMPLIKKFINDIPKLETAPEDGSTRDFENVTNNLDETLREILQDIKEADALSVKTALDADAKKRIEDFKAMIRNGLDNEKAQEFIKSVIRFRIELKKHNIYNLSWSNMVLALMSRNGNVSEVRPLKEWEEMGYMVKQNVRPIGLIGKGFKYIRYNKEEKEKIIEKYLKEKGVNSVEELPPSSKYDLYNRRLRGKPIYGSEYLYTYAAYDKQDVTPNGKSQIETGPDEPETNWWWDKLPADERDEVLTEALIEFAQSDECGNVVVKADNTQEGLGGARGNATSTGNLNLVNDGYMRFPTGVHELLHSLRHFAFASGNNPKLKRFYNRNVDRAVREHEAELCACFVISNYNYDIQPHLNYLKSWTLNGDNCNVVFDQIAEVATFIEKGVLKHLLANEMNNKKLKQN